MINRQIIVNLCLSVSHPSLPVPCEISSRSTNCQIWRCGRANWEGPSKLQRSWECRMNSGRYSMRLMLSVPCYLTSLQFHGTVISQEKNYVLLVFLTISGKSSFLTVYGTSEKWKMSTFVCSLKGRNWKNFFFFFKRIDKQKQGKAPFPRARRVL